MIGSKRLTKGLTQHCGENPPSYEILAFSADVEGRSLYQEFFEKHGDGVHHIGLYVADVDKAMAKWNEKGIKTLQFSGLQQPLYPANGGYGYMETEKLVGILLELMYPPPPGLIHGPR